MGTFLDIVSSAVALVNRYWSCCSQQHLKYKRKYKSFLEKL